VVGIKLNPVGQPYVISAPEVFLEIVEGLKMAGVPMKNIVAYDRYHDQFLQAGFDKWRRKATPRTRITADRTCRTSSAKTSTK
jgi:hypothetical protein